MVQEHVDWWKVANDDFGRLKIRIVACCDFGM